MLVSKAKVYLYNAAIHSLIEYAEDPYGGYELEVDGALVLLRSWREYIIMAPEGKRLQKLKSLTRLHVPSSFNIELCAGGE